MIDHFIMSFLIVSITFLSMGSGFLDENNVSKMAIKMTVTMLIGLFLYISKDSVKGISPGKWIMSIMIRDENNMDNVPSFGRLFIRNLYILIWPVEFIILASSNKKKRLGDNTAKTVVVCNPNKSALLPRILALVGVGMIFFIFTFLFIGSAMKNSDAYKEAIHNIEQNEEIITETGGIKGFGMMPTGGISSAGGSGEAQLRIKVLGNEKDLTVFVYLTKEPNGKWEVVEMN